jgi:hypothetical protein
MVSAIRLELAALICFRLRIIEEACSADNFRLQIQHTCVQYLR